MKNYIKFTIAAICLLALGAPSALAESVYLSDSQMTAAVKVGEGTVEMVGEPTTNSAALTRDGMLILSPNAEGQLSVADADGERAITVLGAVNFDFETEPAAGEYVNFSGELKDGFAQEGAALELSKANIKNSKLRLCWRVYKSDTQASDMIKLTDTNGTLLSKISLSKRSDESVYLSYLDGDSVKRMRNVVINIGEWLDAEAVINLDTRKLDLYVGGAQLLADTPIADSDSPLGEISFGTAIDDISLSSGERIEESALEIGAEDIAVGEDGVYAIDPKVRIRLLGEMHDIDAKYVSLYTDGSGIVSRGGRIFADSDALDEPKTVKITCGAVVSGVEYTAEKTISVSSGGSEGEKLSIACAAEPIIGEDITLRVINGDGKTYKVIAGIAYESGAADFTAQDWLCSSSDEKISIKPPEGDGELSLYIIDMDSGVNLLQQEGV